MAIDPLDRLAGSGAMSSFLAAVALGDLDLVAAPADRITQSSTLSMAERSLYVAWRQLLEPGQGVHVLVPSGPEATALLMRNLEALARVEATDGYEQLYELVGRVVPDQRERHLRLADLYLRLQFADMAGEELMQLAERDGPDAVVLTGLGKVATLKHMWEDAEVLLSESLQLDPGQQDVERLLESVRAKLAG